MLEREREREEREREGGGETCNRNERRFRKSIRIWGLRLTNCVVYILISRRIMNIERALSAKMW